MPRKLFAGLAATVLTASGLVSVNGAVAAASSDPGAGATSSPSSGTTWRKPTAGTSATIAFTDAATSAKAASLSPHLAGIVDTAKRVRTVDIDARALSPSLAAESVDIKLFDDAGITLATTVALSEGVGTGGRTSSTYSAGGKEGAALLTVIGTNVHGVLWKGATRYGIEPIGDGRHLVFEDGRSYPAEDSHAGEDQNVGEGAPAPSTMDTSASTVIDVMVAFDEHAQAYFGSVAATEDEIIEMVNLSNMTYVNSQVDLELALTNALDLNYTRNATDGTTDDSPYLTAIRSKTDGVVDNLHTVRDANDADLVSMITDATSVCGLGRYPTTANPAESDAYTLVDGGCAVGNLSFPHEIGHNLCASHDPANAGNNPCDPDSYAHFSVANNLRTVMSYANDANGCNTCTRIPYFSNPNVTYSGWVTGVTGARDNSRVISAWASTIAAYRTGGTGPGPLACDVDYVIANTWPSNVQVNLVVHNTTTTSTINGWTATWAATGDESVYNSWGVTVSRVGTQVTATGSGFGSSIPPGGNVTVGFQATVSVTPVVPSPIVCTS